jgi:PAS domain S-box-containing protein
MTTESLQAEIARLRAQIAGLDHQVADAKRQQFQAESALKDKTTLFEQLIEHSPVAIYVKNKDGRYLLANQRAASNIGYDCDAMIGKTDLELLPSDQAEVATQWCLNDQEVIATGTSLEREERVTQNDETLVLLTVKFPIRDSSDQIFAVGGVSTDITERKWAEEEIRSLSRYLAIRMTELEAVNTELEAFNDAIVHDLRNPMSWMKGTLHLLNTQYQTALEDKGSEYVERLYAGLERMEQIIDDLRRLSQSRSGELDYTTFHLSYLVRTIVDEIRERDPERLVDVEIEDNIMVRADMWLVRVALENILDNAWKYTSREGRAHICFGVQDHDERRVFFVRDNGTGFEQSKSEQLFTAFKRLHDQKEFPGTGIGLATVRRIIERHQGRVWAESVEGEGSTIFFTLPEPQQ